MYLHLISPSCVANVHELMRPCGSICSWLFSAYLRVRFSVWYIQVELVLVLTMFNSSVFARLTNFNFVWAINCRLCSDRGWAALTGMSRTNRLWETHGGQSVRRDAYLVKITRAKLKRVAAGVADALDMCWLWSLSEKGSRLSYFSTHRQAWQMSVNEKVDRLKRLDNCLDMLARVVTWADGQPSYQFAELRLWRTEVEFKCIESHFLPLAVYGLCWRASKRLKVVKLEPICLFTTWFVFTKR